MSITATHPWPSAGLTVTAGAPLGNQNAAGPHVMHKTREEAQEHLRTLRTQGNKDAIAIEKDERTGEFFLKKKEGKIGQKKPQITPFDSEIRRMEKFGTRDMEGALADHVYNNKQMRKEWEADNSGVSWEDAAADIARELLKTYRRIKTSEDLNMNDTIKACDNPELWDKAKAHISKTLKESDDPEKFNKEVTAHYESLGGTFKKEKTKASEPIDAANIIHANDGKDEPPADENIISSRNVGGIQLPAKKEWVQGQSVSFIYMPAGIHTITAGFRKNNKITVSLIVDKDTPDELQSSFDHLTASYPKQEPYADEDHEGHKATLRFPRGAVQFTYGSIKGDEGVIVSGCTPTSYGADVVNGGTYRSWSPEFGTDADYAKAVEKDGHFTFPDGVRGSASNPARITGINFVTGALTNQPAFRAMPAVKASNPILPTTGEQAPQPEKQNAEHNKEKPKMKVMFINARGDFAAGAVAELEPTHEAIAEGDALPVKAAQAVLAARASEEQTVKAREEKIDAAIVKAVDAGKILPAEKTDKIKARAMRLETAEDGEGVAFIDRMPVKASDKLEKRETSGGDNKPTKGLEVGVSLSDAARGIIKAREPMNNLIRGGKMKEAADLAVESANIANQHFMSIIRGNNDSPMLRDIVKGAGYDVTDPDSAYGMFNTGLIVQQNLGFLAAKLPLKYVSTNLGAQPVQFGQNVLTRYITPANVLMYVPGVGYTSDTTTIQEAGPNTLATDEQTMAGDITPTSSKVRTTSAASVTDAYVTLDMHKGVEIEVPVSKMAATIRNLLTEQYSSQMYRLALVINQHLLGKMFSATWSGTKTSFVKGFADYDIKSFIGIKNYLTICQAPDVQRFALLHSFVYDKVLGDPTLQTSKAILALINKDESSYAASDLPPLYGVKPVESQIASATAAGALTTWTDEAAPGTTNMVGFAGVPACMLFVNRPPNDYISLASAAGVPPTAAVEIVTEPISGLSMLMVRYVDNSKASVIARCAMMYGARQGDPRVGFPIKLS